MPRDVKIACSKTKARPAPEAIPPKVLSARKKVATADVEPIVTPRRRGRPPRAKATETKNAVAAPAESTVASEDASAPSPEDAEVLTEETAAVVEVTAATTETEFQRLFAQWQATGDPQIRDRLILMHRNLVSYLARRFTDRGEMYDDIIQQGLIGLINALDHFDPKRGVRFATFATPTIVGEIRRYFRDKTWGVRVPRRLQELHQAINKKIEILTHELDRSPTYQEIARSLNVDVEQVVEAMEMTYALEPASLDEPSSGEEGGPISDQIGGNDPNLDRWGDYSSLQSALDQLPERQQIVLKLAYFEGFSQAEIARQIKVSPMHVSRLQRRALAQLRELMDEHD